MDTAQGLVVHNRLDARGERRQLLERLGRDPSLTTLSPGRDVPRVEDHAIVVGARLGEEELRSGQRLLQLMGRHRYTNRLTAFLWLKERPDLDDDITLRVCESHDSMTKWTSLRLLPVGLIGAGVTVCDEKVWRLPRGQAPLFAALVFVGGYFVLRPIAGVK